MEDRVRRGAEARQILENPMVVAAFRAIEDELVSKWRMSGVMENAAREELYRMNAAMRMFRARFEAEIVGAEMAYAQAKQRGIEP